jgi:hypothetical protein
MLHNDQYLMQWLVSIESWSYATKFFGQREFSCIPARTPALWIFSYFFINQLYNADIDTYLLINVVKHKVNAAWISLDSPYGQIMITIQLSKENWKSFNHKDQIPLFISFSKSFNITIDWSSVTSNSHDL